jgi:hypothetical protein
MWIFASKLTAFSPEDWVPAFAGMNGKDVHSRLSPG